jgi:AcrR family transcriptional regulator
MVPDGTKVKGRAGQRQVHKKAIMAKRSDAKPRAEKVEEAPLRRILEAAFSAFIESGFAETSTLEIATRARVSKRELYALFRNKNDILTACIRERAKRFQLPPQLPEASDRETFAGILNAFGSRMLREISDSTVVAVFRLAIAEASRSPEVAQALNATGIEASRAALREVMSRACAARIVAGQPAEMAEQFVGLLWRNEMVALLLGVARRPSESEADRRAEAATAALLRLYPEPDSRLLRTCEPS